MRVLAWTPGPGAGRLAGPRVASVPTGISRFGAVHARRIPFLRLLGRSPSALVVAPPPAADDMAAPPPSCPSEGPSSARVGGLVDTPHGSPNEHGKRGAVQT